MRSRLLVLVTLTVVLAACVTINVYFPEAAIKDLSEQIEEEIRTQAEEEAGAAEDPDEPEQAVEESAGSIGMVTDEEILQAYGLIAAQEGLFCEPASAASVAGLMKMSHSGALAEGDQVVCTLTGHGLKDPDTAVGATRTPVTVKASREEVARLLSL